MRGFRIATLSAFIAKGEDGDEGVVAARLGDTWFPLVAADDKRLEQLRPMAKRIAFETKARIELIRFVRGQVLETIDERGS